MLRPHSISHGLEMLLQLSVFVVAGSLTARHLLGARWVPLPRPGVWIWAAMTLAAAARALLAGLLVLSLQVGADGAVPLQELFKSGKADGAITGNPWVKKGTPVTYRIPSLVATNSTLIAFASERLGSSNDESTTNLVQRRSTDGGERWGPLTLVVQATQGMSSAPWAIADDRTSQVLLFWNQNSTADQKCSCGVAMVQGKDGADYSKPVWLPVESGVVGSSLDSGIRLQKGPHAGRLLVCMRKICKNSCPGPYQAFAAFSDDAGTTWHASPHLHDGTTECQVTELSDGTVYMSIRPYVGLANPAHTRFSARSTDGGATFGDLKAEP
eukprot:COSAG02_NODE_1237_length_13725_cov_27.071921_20_plen_327_part_00